MSLLDAGLCFRGEGGGSYPPESEVPAARAAHCAFFEWDLARLDAALIDGWTLPRLRSLHEARDVEPFALHALRDVTFRRGREAVAVRERTERALDFARALGARALVVLPGDGPRGLRASDVVEETGEVLERLAGLAAAAGVRLALAPRTDDASSLRTGALLRACLEALPRAEVAACVDLEDAALAGEPPEWLAGFPAERVAHVRLPGLGAFDAPVGAPAAAWDPPERRARLEVTRIALDALGARGPWALRVPLEAAPHGAPPEECARRAYERLRRFEELVEHAREEARRRAERDAERAYREGPGRSDA